MQTTTFWQQIDKPIIGLSPMDGVTDAAYRFIQKKYGGPAIIYTEFISVEGLCRGAEIFLKELIFNELERPIIAQIYGITPKYFRQTATLLCELGFDGIDINMGCPAKNVAHSGAGAALINTPKLAQKIVEQTKFGVEDWVNGKSTADCDCFTTKIIKTVKQLHQQLPEKYQQRRSIPVSIKTRIGYDCSVVDNWIPTLLETQPSAIALHGRTLKQYYAGQANWEAIAQAAELVRQTNTLILGNGDVTSIDQAQAYASKYNVDGILIGRASWGNPFVFQTFRPDLSATRPNFHIALEHAVLYETIFEQTSKYSFLPMRKHLGWYVKSIPNAKKIRQALCLSNSSQEVKEILKKHQLI